jgi:hypothetical protein
MLLELEESKGREVEMAEPVPFRFERLSVWQSARGHGTDFGSAPLARGEADQDAICTEVPVVIPRLLGFSTTRPTW